MQTANEHVLASYYFTSVIKCSVLVAMGDFIVLSLHLTLTGTTWQLLYDIPRKQSSVETTMRNSHQQSLHHHHINQIQSVAISVGRKGAENTLTKALINKVTCNRDNTK